MTGGLRKTNKETLLQVGERVDPITDNVDEAAIIDGMAMVQKAKTRGLKFCKLAKQLFTTTLVTGSDFWTIDVVFDQYKNNSIKNAECNLGRVGSLVFK